ncbi:MAG: HD-GYP domain-containing protein [Phycisphaerae bacterium]
MSELQNQLPTPAHEPAALAPPTPEALLARLEQAAHTAERIHVVVEENELLSHELCRNYEQIHQLIDFTCEIAGVTDPREIKRLLLARVAMLLAAARLDVYVADGRWRRFEMVKSKFIRVSNDAVPPADLAPLTADARSSRQTTVKCNATSRILITPLARLENQVDVVFIERPIGAPEFTSADLRFCETLLAFGGQILCNTELHERVRQTSMESTRALVAAIDKKDRYTSGHSERVGFLSRRMAEWLKLGREEVDQLEWAGLLHDVGKIGIPEEILNKPGKLTPEEFETIKKHPEMGYEILKHIQSFQHILDGVLYHHEQPDGGGYPRGLREDEIPLSARVIHVADVFDALSSARSYRGKFDIQRALDIMRSEAGTKLDARIVPVFFEVLEHLRAHEQALLQQVFPHLEGVAP